MCPSSCFSRKYLKKHIRIHVKEKPVKCNQCKFSTFKSGGLSRHIRTVHERYVKFYTAHIQVATMAPHKRIIWRDTGPDTTWINSLNVQFHAHIHHVNTEPAPLPLCKNMFTFVITRTGQEISCPKCRKSFYKNYALYKHINVVHAKDIISGSDLSSVAPFKKKLLKKYFQCELCDDRAGHREQLNDHKLTIHSDVWKKCDSPGCNYMTNYARVFRTHVLIHEKYPVVCRFPACDYRRRSRGELK